MKNEIILRFCIFNFEDITHDEITQLVGIQPAVVHFKGQKRNPKNPDSPLIKQNSWMMDSQKDKYSSFADQMDNILDIIESRIDTFKLICEKYACEFSCALFIYHGNQESTPWINLGARYNKLIKDLNIDFDLDLYVRENK